MLLRESPNAWAAYEGADRPDARLADRAGTVRRDLRRLRSTTAASSRACATPATPCDVIELAGRHPLADDAARDCGPRGLGSVAGGSRPIIDGLGLPAFAGWTTHWRPRRRRPDPPPDRAGDRLQRDRARGAARDRAAPAARGSRALIVTSDTTAERLAADFGVDRDRIARRRARHRRRAAQPRLRRDRPAASSRSARWCRARGTTCCCARWPGCSTSTGSSPSSVRRARSGACACACRRSPRNLASPGACALPAR